MSCILEKSNKNALIPLLIIVLAVFGRGILLEYTDLIDPTEARYASVAQQMLLTDDWVTPKLPLPDGVSPYLGKPPLHFWLTALSYSIFEVDEWTARLPSLLSTILLLLVVYNFTAKARGPEIGLVAALVFLSSWMSFFVAGASVVDVTLSALVCTGILYLFKAFENSEVDRRDFLIATIFAALSFLTKGPVGPVLIAIPLLLWLALDKRLSQIKQIPWISSALLFVLIVAPWFVMAELRNPGFTKYFFWNENIARYLFRDYGDKYGTGHHYPYGTAWLMLAIAYMPWTFVLVYQVFSRGWKQTVQLIKGSKTSLFVFCWALSAPLFFSFVKQLQPMYILSSVPGLAILTSFLLEPAASSATSLRTKIPSLALLALGSVLIFAGGLMAPDRLSIQLGVGILVISVSLVFMMRGKQFGYPFVTHFAAICLSAYLVGLVAFTPFTNYARSSEEILAAAEGCSINGKQIVAVDTANVYSHYWAAGTGTEELRHKLEIQFVDRDQQIPQEVCYVMVNKPEIEDQLVKRLSGFEILKSGKRWVILRRTQPQL